MSFMPDDGKGRIVSHLVEVNHSGVLISGRDEPEALSYQIPLLDLKAIDFKLFFF
jgi:hypothetical protein